MRGFFDKELEKLNVLMVEMGLQIENAISSCIVSLVEQDKEKAEEAIEEEQRIDFKERQIEDLCYRLIVQQQPVAGDFRKISSALKMITDMERIGDQAADIAQLSLEIKEQMEKRDFNDLKKMADETSKMVTHAIDAFVDNNEEKARQVIKNDDLVDGLFEIVKEDIVESIQKDSEDPESSLNYFMIAKYFERIGDHATNIAEAVIFSITGKQNFYQK